MVVEEMESTRWVEGRRLWDRGCDSHVSAEFVKEDGDLPRSCLIGRWGITVVGKYIKISHLE